MLLELSRSTLASVSSKGTMVSGAIVLYQGKRGAGLPALKCCARRIEAPLSALNFTLPE
jgi:hypothetical protein